MTDHEEWEWREDQHAVGDTAKMQKIKWRNNEIEHILLIVYLVYLVALSDHVFYNKKRFTMVLSIYVL